MSAAELYHRALIDLAKEAQRPARLDQPSLSLAIDNPLCGDRVTLDLALDAARITAVGHKVRGCLLCQAATALLARHAPGLTIAELRAAGDRIAAFVKDGGSAPEGWDEMAHFAPVRTVKARHDCVLLPFRALRAAPEDSAVL